jgi:hypothetical protein
MVADCSKLIGAGPQREHGPDFLYRRLLDLRGCRS